MFAKLLKYEWRATSKTLGILSLAAVGAAILGTGMLRLLTGGGEPNPVLLVLAVVMLFSVFIGLFGYVIAAEFLLLARFYRNKFTDEGYLTFTLPVSSHSLVLSTLVNMVVWGLISTLVLLGSFAMIIFVGTASTGFVNRDILNGMQEVFRQVSLGYATLGIGRGYEVLTGVNMVLTMLTSNVTTIAAITIGASLAKKHKILAAFGIYYGIQMVVSALTSTANAAATVMSNGAQNLLFSSVFQLLLTLILLIGGYLLTNYFMRKKLNLA